MRKFSLLLIVMILLSGTIASCSSIQDPLAGVSVPSIGEIESADTVRDHDVPVVFSSAQKMPSTYFHNNLYFRRNPDFMFPTVSGCRTFMKYDLETGAESPVCIDPMCQHELLTEESRCPFKQGAKVFAIKDEIIYYCTEFPDPENAASQYYKVYVYSYDLRNMRKISLFSYFDGVFGNEVLNMIDKKIYYGDYDVHDDLSVDRYFCVYDLSKGKSERLFRYNSFENPDTGWIDKIQTETDLSLMFVNNLGEVFLHDKTAVYCAKTEKNAEIRKIADLGEYEGLIFNGYWREGKLYFIAGKKTDQPKRILCVDCSSGKTEIVASDAALDFTMSGDLLCYWLYDPAELAPGCRILSHSIVVMDLKNGVKKTVEFDCGDGFPYLLSDPLLYGGKIYLCNTQRFMKRNGTFDDSISDNSTLVFDLDNGTWNVLFEVTLYPES